MSAVPLKSTSLRPGQVVLIETGSLVGGVIQFEGAEDGWAAGAVTTLGANLTLAAGTLDLALPTTDPGVAGRIWCDTDNGNVLKVSTG
jgi:hypothetical protein